MSEGAVAGLLDVQNLDTKHRIIFLSRYGSLVDLARLAVERGDEVVFYQKTIGPGDMFPEGVQPVESFRKYLDWPTAVVFDDPEFALRRKLFLGASIAVGPTVQPAAWIHMAPRLGLGTTPATSSSTMLVMPQAGGMLLGPVVDYYRRRTKAARLLEAAISRPFPELRREADGSCSIWAFSVRCHKNIIYLLAEAPVAGYRVLENAIRDSRETVGDWLQKFRVGGQVNLARRKWWQRAR